MEEGRGRRLRWAGLALVALSLFLPVHGCRVDIGDFEPPPAPAADGSRSVVHTTSPLRVPVESIPEDFARGFAADGVRGGLREVRCWYPYSLVPFWVLLLAGASRADAAGRRRLGVLALAISGLLLVFEATYLWTTLGTGWNRWGVASARPLQVAGVWLVVLLVLAHRAPGRRRVEDVEATVSSQALLGALHAFSFPAWDLLRPVLDGHGPWPAFATVSCNYRWGLWVAVLGFLLVARPGSLPGVPAGQGYDRRLPCPSPSSTPTPTSTSTGSTATATRSSTAPAPRGS
jgi:hypothetical protein